MSFVVGHYRACAVRADGRVVCWGPGLASLPKDGSVGAEPKLVPGLVDAEQVAGDDWYFCARRKNREVSCWEPDMKLKAVELSEVVEISMTCARHADGRVSQWLTPGGEVALVPGITDARSLGQGQGPPCVITRAGKALCWGANVSHQLGDGTRQSRDTPGPVKNLSNVDEIGTSLSFDECARIGGDVKCWGGELGVNALPTPMPTLHDVAHIAVGEYHSCALRKNGTVACWGFNATGQLGIPSSKTPDHKSLTPVDVPGIRDVVELELGGGEPSTGAGSTCVRTQGGEISCWGALGDGENPVRVSLEVR